MTRLEEVKIRIFAIEILQLLKTEYSYKELSSLTKLPISVLSRYVNGHVLPNLKRSEEIIELFKREYLTDLLKKKIKIDKKTGIFDHSKVLSDTNLLNKIAKLIFQWFRFVEVDRVLTVQTAGIPLAVQTGNEFGVDVLIARNKKEMGIEEFIEAKRVYSEGTYTHLYLPKGLIKKNDNVLIVDDLIRSGSAIRALLKICKEAKASVVGIFVLLAVEDTIEKMRERAPYPIKSLIKI